MKTSFFAVALSLMCSQVAFAQQPKEIKVDTFISKHDDHSIHKMNPVEVISKVEGNKTCLYEDNGECGYWAMRDKIVLKISGMAEANFGGFDKIIAREERVMDNYESGKSITNIELKGVSTSETGTLVYDNVGWLQWGGSIPFEFKIEINNDLNKPTEEREFRIPIARKGIFRFSVVYVDNKWSVTTLPMLASPFSITTELAETLLKLKDNKPGVTYAQYNIECLNVENLAPVCFAQDYDGAVKIEDELASTIYKAAKANLDFFQSYVKLSVDCQSPNEWNDIKETTCKISINE